MLMKTLLTILLFFCSALTLQAQSISHIETTKSWYYIYAQGGKKLMTVSTSQGELKGFSSSFYILQKGSFYITYDVRGKKIHTFSVSSVGNILGVTGDTFTSCKGAWIYTWSKDGKKLSTRAAR